MNYVIMKCFFIIQSGTFQYWNLIIHFENVMSL